MSKFPVVSILARRRLLVGLLIVALLCLLSSATAQDAPPADTALTDVPTEAPTDAPAEPPTPEATNAPTDTPPDLPPTETPIEPTAPTVVPTEIPTTPPAEPSPTAPVVLRPRPQIAQTFCKLGINDLADGNPFTYRFAAVEANNIASFTWNLGDGTAGSTQTIDHTYAATGVYQITLVCTPQPGFGSPITLKGSISISSAPVADFTLTPATMITALPPFSITTVNKSTGGALTYDWKVTDDTLANVLYSGSSENISYSFPTYGTYWFVLTVTDGAGLSASKSQSVVLSAPPPSARFTLAPSDGTSPLTVTVQEDDLQTGPIDTLTWDFGDGSPVVTGPGPHSHTYTLAAPDQAETFTISLSYSGPGGSGTFSREVGVYPGGDPVFAVFETETMTNVPGGMEVCFRNLSTGPVAFNRWDFDNDGSYDLVSGDALVCHTYTSEATYFVRLRVENADGSSTSTASNIVSIIFAPVAAFTVSPGTSITWGDLIDLDSSGSTGAIDTWAWDFNGDGTTDSTEANPQDVSLTQLGSHPIRLTVTGPGGSSTAEAIIFVARLDITCDFTGMLDVLPTAGDQTYTSVIGNQGGRAISYAWTITGGTLGAPLTFNTADFTLDWADYGAGTFVVRLDASTLDGSECSTTKTVTRSYPALNCLMTDNLPPTLYADGSTYTFTADVQNLASRPMVSFDWEVNGLPQGVNASTFNYSWNTPPVAPVTETIRYTVVVDDGGGQTSSCYEERAVTLNPWPAPTCSMTSNLPGTLYADGRTYNFDANVANLFGRTVTEYRWYVNGVLQSTTAADTPFAWTNITDTSLLPYSATIRVEADVDNNNGTTSSCSASITASVSAWPALTCTSIGGQANPIPVLPDNPTRSYTYTANVSGVANRTAVYTWTVDTGTVTSANPRTNNNQAIIRWPSSASARTPGLPSVIGVNVVVTNPDGTTSNTSCGFNRTVSVQVPALTCNLPGGDSTPVLNETNSYTMNLVNRYGRAFTSVLWELEYDDGAAWQPVTTGSSTAFSYQFINPNVQYRLRYTASVGDPADNCTSQWYDISAYNNGVDFFCDAFPTAGNNFSPASASASYAYTVDMDNGNGLGLRYTWVLVGPNGAERVLGTSTSTGNGLITGPAFLGSAFSPVGNYTLRVDVEAQNPADSSYTCSLARGLTVGTLNVTYSYTGEGGALLNNTAVAVGQSICLTNNSSTSHGDISQLLYQWNISAASGNAANNTLNGTSFSGQQLPGCIAFNEPGEYTIQLQGRNDDQGDASFSRSVSASVTYFVYGLQNIAINRSNATFAPATVNFQAVGTNITGSYTWQFINRGTGATVATRTGANVSQYFNTPGDYRAIVSGSGPLGTTTAQADFTLLATNQLRAAFVPSVYGGIAPMSVCFTDRSVGNNIQSWTWDFGNGQTLTYTPANIPSSICTTYNTPSSAYTVRLTISNGTLTETATNTVRTYNLLESSATFSITPRGGGQFCFTAVVDGGVSVTGWDYGDSSAGPAQNTVCHAYSASGTYLVSMFIEDGSGGTGTVVREVVVDLNGGSNPVLAVSGLCSADRTATFTVTNTGGAMTSPDQVIVRDRNGSVVLLDSLMLGANASRNYVVSNQSGAVTFTTADFGLTAATTCNYPPEISVSAACGANPAFTITNDGGDMVLPQAYTITNDAGATVDSGSIQLAAGASQTITLAGLDPYAGYRIQSSGLAGTIDMTQSCQRPALAVSATCTPMAAFTVTNRGGDMLSRHAYRLTDASGANRTPANNTFQLRAGRSAVIPVPDGVDLAGGVTFQTDDLGITASSMLQCQPSASAPPVTDSSAAGAKITTAPTPGGDRLRFNGLSPDLLKLPAWDSVPTCGHSCPTFRLYHTDETGDWEIFRLDGADKQTRSYERHNLTFGEGENVTDMSPSLSPNNEWIVFSSNRDGNWELYVAATSGDPDSVQRVTYNTIAIDTDPMWGPNNYVVFESSRNGNWDLYLVDMNTGLEYRLTEDDADDINPFWSPDGSRIVFQSSRDQAGGERAWQIYELDLNMLTVTRLSDGSHIDVDPQYSGSGQHIVYRTYEAANGNSVIAIMDADGRNGYSITTPLENATNPAWSPQDHFIAYQSDLDGDLDIYIYDVTGKTTRKLTDNGSGDYAPSWLCDESRVLFTSNATGNPDIFEAEAQPISAPPIIVKTDADQMTFEASLDIYPQNTPGEENASREGQTVLGPFGQQTLFLFPDVAHTPVDLSLDGLERRDWAAPTSCLIAP